MRENRTYGSEGGERLLFPTPIKVTEPTVRNRKIAPTGRIYSTSHDWICQLHGW